MEYWNQQIKISRYMLLGTVIATVVNLAFLLGNVDMYISYSGAAAYYPVWLGKLFDNGNYPGPVNSDYTATGLLMAGVVLAGYLAVWWLARDRKIWLKVSLWIIVADLAFLLLVAWTLFSNPMSCFWEAVIHLAVIYEIAQGLKALGRKEAYLARQAEEARVAEDCLL